MVNFLYDFIFYAFFQIILLILWISLFTIATPRFPRLNVGSNFNLSPKIAVQFGLETSSKKSNLSEKKDSFLKNRENVMLVLLCLEMAIGSVCLLSIAYAIFVPNLFGHLCVLLLIILAGSESALGLAMLMVIYKIYHMVSFDTLRSLKG